MSRYAIWDKQSSVITPSGKVFSAEEWMEKYPVARIDSIKIVCAGGEINGAFFGTFGQMKETYANYGCDFSDCITDQDVLDAIEAFETADHSDGESTPEERIAAALELNNLLNTPVVNTDDPDED